MSDKDFVTAFTVLQERQGEPRLTTGSAGLDSLLGGGIHQGTFHLFYGDQESGIDLLLHHILVNALLPIDKGGFGGKALYLNCGNYREERTILDVRQLTWLVKSVGLDPVRALDRIRVFLAFNLEQEEQVVERVAQALREDPEVKALVVHNLAKLFDPEGLPRQSASERLRRISRLQGVISKLSQTCAERGIAIVASCRPRIGVRGKVPKPEGGQYLRHACNILVYMRRVESKGALGVQAYLLKHPSREPTRVTFTFKKGGVDLGRITIPFRTMFEEELENLKRGFREALLNPARREAFDHVVKGWTSEIGAMSYTKVPTVLDVMLLTGLVDNRRAIDDLNEQVRVLRERLEEIREMVKGLAVPIRREDL